MGVLLFLFLIIVGLLYLQNKKLEQFKEKKEVEEIKTIIKEDVLNQKTDSTKLPEEKSPDIILEWKDEG